MYGRPVLAILSKKVESKKDDVPLVGVPKKYEWTAKRGLVKYFGLKTFPDQKTLLLVAVLKKI